MGGGYAPGSSAPSATALARARQERGQTADPTQTKKPTQWTNRVTDTVRDNGDLTLETGDRIRHADFGDGRVTAVTGVGPKRIAEVQFEHAGRKRLLIKVSPIEKLYDDRSPPCGSARPTVHWLAAALDALRTELGVPRHLPARSSRRKLATRCADVVPAATRICSTSVP